MIVQIWFVLALLLLAAAPSGGLKDQRLAPITKEDLVSQIRNTSLSSPLHDKLIIRGLSARLFDELYQEYKRLWKSNPNSGRANYLVGYVAMESWIIRSMRNLLPPNSPVLQGLYKAAHDRFQRAYELDPNSAPLNSRYGYLLWSFDHDFERGLSMLKKAVSLTPKDASARTWLALIYSNPSGKDYDPKKAEAELKTAIRLDPAYLPAHYVLVGLYHNLKRHEEAKREEQAWKNLVPDGVDSKRILKIY